MIWPAAEPAAQGLSGKALDAAAEFASSFGGGSGCVVRHGQLVKEWGAPDTRADIKSATKASVGITVLGLAIGDGLVGWDDRATLHYPRLGLAEGLGEPAEGWLDEITIRHLATMSAGFDDERPAQLVQRPGTAGVYSNDTTNILAELLTRVFKEDLRELFRRRIMQPLGVPEEAWAWRDNGFRPKQTAGLASREFASGITITHRALARLGELYLRDGMWEGRRLLPEGFVQHVSWRPDLPTPSPCYGYYWFSNRKGAYRHVPPDVHWAAGLGDSWLFFCPSLDLVVVRLGTGGPQSHLYGADRDASRRLNNGGAERALAFFHKVARAVRDFAPPSRVVNRVEWAPKAEIVRLATGKGTDGSDVWASTWADDGDLYTTYGDGYGFDPIIDEKLSLGFAKVSGAPPALQGFNIRSKTGEDRGHGPAGKKASGLLMVDGTLYMWARNAGNAQLAWSEDHAVSWTWAPWRFTTSFGCPTFLNFGRNYAGARDEYVYSYSQDAGSAYLAADSMVLARVPKGQLREREAYEFFRYLDRDGRPAWTPELEARGAVFTAAGRCYRSGITYNAGLGRYLWCQITPNLPNMRQGGREHDVRFRGGFRILEAPEPWGPWSTVYATDEWDVGPGETSSLPTPWMSDDGRTCHLLFSGDDQFSVRRVVFG